MIKTAIQAAKSAGELAYRYFKTLPAGRQAQSASRRLDLDGNGVILMIGDETQYAGKLFQSCSN